ncbi:MAG: hypothetical protein HYY62_02430 [Deltaproteobacteria bacterium]|nr:hypothetical protein [Deltaproteobacteria bacterium]
MITHPQERGFTLLKTTFNEDAPLNVQYSPQKYQPKGSHRGSAARAVPVHLSLYQAEKEAPKKEMHKKNLLAALKNYEKNLPSLMAHLRRDMTHMGADSLAPYYLYSSVPYATAATRLLLDKEVLTNEEREELLHVQGELRTALLSLIEKEGLFESQGGEFQHYSSSVGYVNPLGGLALIPLAEECGKGGHFQPSTGILNVE